MQGHTPPREPGTRGQQRDHRPEPDGSRRTHGKARQWPAIDRAQVAEHAFLTMPHIGLIMATAAVKCAKILNTEQYDAY